MPTYTSNLRVPHLEQNVAQPEIPENIAKEIFDRLIAGQATITMSDADYTITHTDSPVNPAEEWHNNFFTFNNGTQAADRNVILPTYKRDYIFKNNTNYSLTFKCTGQTGVSVLPGNTILAYCNGTDILQYVFSNTNSYNTKSVTSSSGTLDINVLNVQIFTLTMTEAITSLTLPTAYNSYKIELIVTQDATTPYDFDDNTNVIWENGNAPTAAQGGAFATSSVNIIKLTKVGGSWYGRYYKGFA